MKIAFYGSSLLSCYWNGAATYYRGLLEALSQHGHDITFYEPDAFGRQQNRDMDPPDWCAVVVYEASPEGLRRAAADAAKADVVVKASGVGYEDEALLEAVLAAAPDRGVRIFWDVDAPATLAQLHADENDPLRRALPQLDLVLTYGGGQPVIDAYRNLRAAECIPVYNALDPASHHPVPQESRFVAALGFLGNRLPDREARVEEFFLGAAEAMANSAFLLGGSGWTDRSLPDNVRAVGHVPTRHHNAFNVSPRAILNVNREGMAKTGFSPPTRVFEAAGAGACLICDDWPGLQEFLTPGDEVLVARDGKDVVEHLRALTAQQAEEIGGAALRRVLGEHTYAKRAAQVDRILRRAQARKREEVAA